MFFVHYGAVVCAFIFLESYGAMRCGFVRGEIVRCGRVRLNHTAPQRTHGTKKNGPKKDLFILPIRRRINDEKRHFKEYVEVVCASTVSTIPV